MSLRTLLISELNALAKKGNAEELQACLRRTMVDRPLSSLDPEEQDPVDTAAFAWQTTAPRGCATFEIVATQAINNLKVPVQGSMVDWPFVHAMIRLLAKLPTDKTSAKLKESTNTHLDGLLVRRAVFLQALTPLYAKANFLSLDVLKLWLRWNPAQDPSWVEPLFTATLQDPNWPLAEGAAVILMELASSAPELVTAPWLKRFWSAGRSRAPRAEVRELIFGIGNALHLTDAGLTQLGVLHRELQNESVSFLEDAAELFLGDPEREQLLALGQPSVSPKDRFVRYRDQRDQPILPALLKRLAA